MNKHNAGNLIFLSGIFIFLLSCGQAVDVKSGTSDLKKYDKPGIPQQSIPSKVGQEIGVTNGSNSETDLEKTPVGNERFVLYRESIETHWNEWFGTLIRKSSDDTLILIESEGKTSEFIGVMSHTCKIDTMYYWKTASDFGSSIDLDTEGAISIPTEVAKGAFDKFCR